MKIFVNQVGYAPVSKKRATVLLDGIYYAVNKETGDKVKLAAAKSKGYDETAGEDCYMVDFSNITSEGTYYIESEDGSEKSDSFKIQENVYAELLRDLVKCLYYQRCGCALEEKYAGEYSHAVCHTEPSIFLQDYIDKVANPKKVDMTGGWHDAGDFGKYISPAGVTIGHLLYAYELFNKEMLMDLNIPETGNGIPDLLNEIRYELDWMFKMQNDEGGVYHKITGFSHCPFLMPEDDKDQMLIFPVSSLATADFAATMAMVSRVYRQFDEAYADKALEAARKAFGWLEANDYVGFKNPLGANTGEYDDDEDEDERMWAAAELLRSDSAGNVEGYRNMLNKYAFSDIDKTDFGWTDVAGLAALSVLTDPAHTAGKEVEEIFYKAVFEEVDRLLAIMKKSGYELGMLTEDFVWGSNMVVTNRGALFAFAAWLLNNREEASKYANNSLADYKDAAQNHVHYILGRNALGRSYVTRYGEHAFENPHNRTSACDGIEEVMPGWVSGGPFKDFVDADALKLLVKGTAPQKCHADVVGSYSTNEITIYWNSSMALLMAGVINLK